MNNLQSLQYYYPEILLTILILVSIIYDLFLDKSKSDRVGIVLIAGLVLIAFSVFLQDEKITSLFTNSVAKDPFSQFFKITIILSTVIVSIISLKNEELKIYKWNSILWMIFGEKSKHIFFITLIFMVYI